MPLLYKCLRDNLINIVVCNVNLIKFSLCVQIWNKHLNISSIRHYKNNKNKQKSFRGWDIFWKLKTKKSEKLGQLDLNTCFTKCEIPRNKNLFWSYGFRKTLKSFFFSWHRTNFELLLQSFSLVQFNFLPLSFSQWLFFQLISSNGRAKNFWTS